MGLSSSQARLLTLTRRMHDIEYKAQRLEAQKLRLANDSKKVYEDYLNALDAVKIQSRTLESNGSFSYSDVTYNRLCGTKFGDSLVYILKDTETGKAYVPEEYKCAYDSSNKSLSGFLKTLNSIKSGASLSYTSITSAAQLMSLSNSSGNYRLDCDITVSDWEGIENFQGVFDGNGHTITIASGTCGLFESTNGATIRNITVDANVNSNRNYAAGLIRMAEDTTVENSSVTGSITAGCVVGGLISYLKGNSTVSNCESSATVYSNRISPTNGYDAAEASYSKSYAGGLIGWIGSGASSNITINDCVSNAKVKSEYWILGGFSGYINGNVEFNNCVSNAEVIGNCNGRGDDFKTMVEGGAAAALQVATFNGGSATNRTIVVNNCNSSGSVSANGNPDYSRFDDFAWNTSLMTFNNFYSNLKNTYYTVPNPNVYAQSVNPSDYPNLTENEIEDAVGVYSILEKTNGGVCIPADCADDVEWFSNIINYGCAIISQVDISDSKEYSIYDVNVAIDPNLREVPDETMLRKAEAQYEADMRKIDIKDRRYDIDLAALDNERNAIKSEMETLKTVAKDNVERTFKLFS